MRYQRAQSFSSCDLVLAVDGQVHGWLDLTRLRLGKL